MMHDDNQTANSKLGRHPYEVIQGERDELESAIRRNPLVSAEILSEIHGRPS